VIQALPKLIKLNPIVVKEVFNRLLGTQHGRSIPFILGRRGGGPERLWCPLRHTEYVSCVLEHLGQGLRFCHKL
jgi:symplekin